MWRGRRAPGADGLFFARLSCLSFMIVNRGLANQDSIKRAARAAIFLLSRFETEEGEQSDDEDGSALRNARRIDNYFETARQFCLHGLRGAFGPGMTEEQVKKVLNHEDVSMLERIIRAAGPVANIDEAIFMVTEPIYSFASYLILKVRGAHFDKFDQTGPVEPIRFFGSTAGSPVFLPQFIFLHQRLRLLCSYSSKLRDIIDGQNNGAYQEILESLGTLWGESDKYKWSGVRQRHLMERQLWRLQDFRDGGGFGFWVEVFFLVTQQLFHVQLSPEADSTLSVGMFRAITSNWRQHKHSLGTQRVVLNLTCDLAIFGRSPLSKHPFPKYITDELLVRTVGEHGGGAVWFAY
ncbi:hypothetical protein EDB85DRAFT_761296 [Lactarius pseudohatsudake]|nr:hypothetical protein EDB85DRAFT_761296 [Lactarius pseudohatsudake]